MIRYWVWDRILCRWIGITTTRAIWLATPLAVGIGACIGGPLAWRLMPLPHAPPAAPWAGLPAPAGARPVAVLPGWPAPWGGPLAGIGGGGGSVIPFDAGRTAEDAQPAVHARNWDRYRDHDDAPRRREDVPEPGGVIALALGMLAWVRRRHAR